MMNGKETIFIGIVPKSTGNPLLIAKNVDELLTELKKELACAGGVCEIV